MNDKMYWMRNVCGLVLSITCADEITKLVSGALRVPFLKTFLQHAVQIQKYHLTRDIDLRIDHLVLRASLFDQAVSPS